MTSENDGRDVKRGQKGKSYLIELYKTLDAQLNADSDIVTRIAQVSTAWRSVHSLCGHSHPSTHQYLLAWIQRHTSRTVLQPQWTNKPEIQCHHDSLKQAIQDFINEAQIAITSRSSGAHSWESQLLERAEWYLQVLPNIWGHPVLNDLLNPEKKRPSDDDVISWLKEERGITFVSRLRQLVLDSCRDLALSIAADVLGRARAGVEQNDEVTENTPAPCSSFEQTLRTQAGFTQDLWDYMTDLELVFLHKLGRNDVKDELMKRTPLESCHAAVDRLAGRLKLAPGDKKLWKDAVDVANYYAQMTASRCMKHASCTGVVRTTLYWCSRTATRHTPREKLPKMADMLTALAATSHHLYTFAAAIHKELLECSDARGFVCELFIRALTAGMNELEKLKLATTPEQAMEKRQMEQLLAKWFYQLGTTVLESSVRMKFECMLTAFSIHPAQFWYEKIQKAPELASVNVESIPEDQESQPSTSFSSWANDSRKQSNFVKTSESLNLKDTEKISNNVLSTAIFTEGERLGLTSELCQDLAGLLSVPRLRTLSWDMDRELLLENCRSYMERTAGGTRALIFESYSIDHETVRLLPEEDDGEDDMFYGIEKGYENDLEFEPQPEEIWQNAYNNPDKSDSAASDLDDLDYTISTKCKKKTRHISESDSDPLSLVAESNRTEKKKERPHSKERSKQSKKKGKSKDKKEQKETKTLKEKKERKKKDKSEVQNPKLSNLLGVKVEYASFEDEFRNTIKLTTTKVGGATPVTDSDYDSQGKSSFYSEGTEPDVLRDGNFPVDELIQSLKVNTQLSSNKVDPLSIAVGSNNLDKHKQAKDSVAKLLQYRKQKAEETLSRNNSTPCDVQSNLTSLVGAKIVKNTNSVKLNEMTKELQRNPNQINVGEMCPKAQPNKLDSAKKSRPAILSAPSKPLRQTTSKKPVEDMPLLPAPVPKALQTSIGAPSSQPSAYFDIHQNIYQQFLMDLEKTKSFTIDGSKNKTGDVSTKKPARPRTKLTPIASKKTENSTSQSAKLTGMKIENAPNTFARRNHMHKTSKQVAHHQESLQSSISRELDQRVTNMTDTKIRQLQTQHNLSISRVGKATDQYKESPRVEVQLVEKPTPACNLVLDHPSGSAVTVARNPAYVNEAPNQTSPTMTPVYSSFSKQDQDDILSLQLQRNRLNHRVETQTTPSVSETAKTKSSNDIASQIRGMPNKLLFGSPTNQELLNVKIPQNTVTKTANMVQNPKASANSKQIQSCTNNGSTANTHKSNEIDVKHPTIVTTKKAFNDCLTAANNSTNDNLIPAINLNSQSQNNCTLNSDVTSMNSLYNSEIAAYNSIITGLPSFKDQQQMAAKNSYSKGQMTAQSTTSNNQSPTMPYTVVSPKVLSDQNKTTMDNSLNCQEVVTNPNKNPNQSYNYTQTGSLQANTSPTLLNACNTGSDKIVDPPSQDWVSVMNNYRMLKTPCRGNATGTLRKQRKVKPNSNPTSVEREKSGSDLNVPTKSGQQQLVKSITSPSSVENPKSGSDLHMSTKPGVDVQKPSMIGDCIAAKTRQSKPRKPRSTKAKVSSPKESLTNRISVVGPTDVKKPLIQYSKKDPVVTGIPRYDHAMLEELFDDELLQEIDESIEIDLVPREYPSVSKPLVHKQAPRTDAKHVMSSPKDLKEINSVQIPHNSGASQSPVKPEALTHVSSKEKPRILSNVSISPCALSPVLKDALTKNLYKNIPIKLTDTVVPKSPQQQVKTVPQNVSHAGPGSIVNSLTRKTVLGNGQYRHQLSQEMQQTMTLCPQPQVVRSPSTTVIMPPQVRQHMTLPVKAAQTVAFEEIISRGTVPSYTQMSTPVTKCNDVTRTAYCIGIRQQTVISARVNITPSMIVHSTPINIEQSLIIKTDIESSSMSDIDSNPLINNKTKPQQDVVTSPIKTYGLDKNQNERLHRKRLSIINRQIGHGSHLPPIELPYSPIILKDDLQNEKLRANSKDNLVSVKACKARVVITKNSNNQFSIESADSSKNRTCLHAQNDLTNAQPKEYVFPQKVDTNSDLNIDQVKNISNFDNQKFVSPIEKTVKISSTKIKKEVTVVDVKKHEIAKKPSRLNKTAKKPVSKIAKQQLCKTTAVNETQIENVAPTRVSKRIQIKVIKKGKEKLIRAEQNRIALEQYKSLKSLNTVPVLNQTMNIDKQVMPAVIHGSNEENSYPKCTELSQTIIMNPVASILQSDTLNSVDAGTNISLLKNEAGKGEPELIEKESSIEHVEHTLEKLVKDMKTTIEVITNTTMEPLVADQVFIEQQEPTYTEPKEIIPTVQDRTVQPKFAAVKHDVRESPKILVHDTELNATQNKSERQMIHIDNSNLKFKSVQDISNVIVSDGLEGLPDSECALPKEPESISIPEKVSTPQTKTKIYNDKQDNKDTSVIKNISDVIELESGSDTESEAPGVLPENRSKTSKYGAKANGEMHWYHEGIKIEEISMPAHDKGRKKLRIIMPDNKIYISTISGNISGRECYDIIFQNPAFKNALLSGCSQKKIIRFNTESFKPENTFTKNSAPLKSHSKPENIDTVNLISDDEEESAEHSTTNREPTVHFSTEFGKYAVKSMDENTFEKHQSKFSQRCVLKLSKCDNIIDGHTNNTADAEGVQNIRGHFPAVSEIIDLEDSSSDDECVPVDVRKVNIDEFKHMLLQDYRDVLIPQQKRKKSNLKEPYALNRPIEPVINIVETDTDKSYDQRSTIEGQLKSKSKECFTSESSIEAAISISESLTDESLAQKPTIEQSYDQISTIEDPLKNKSKEPSTSENSMEAANSISESLTDESLALISTKESQEIKELKVPCASERSVEDVVNIDETFSAAGSRRNSFSILNDDYFDVSLSSVLDDKPLQDDVFDQLKSTEDDIVLSEKQFNLVVCDAEWFSTKKAFNQRSYKEDDIPTSSPTNTKLEESTDCENASAEDSFIEGGMSESDAEHVPSLITIMSQYFAENRINNLLKSGFYSAKGSTLLSPILKRKSTENLVNKLNKISRRRTVPKAKTDLNIITHQDLIFYSTKDIDIKTKSNETNFKLECNPLAACTQGDYDKTRTRLGSDSSDSSVDLLENTLIIFHDSEQNQVPQKLTNVQIDCSEESEETLVFQDSVDKVEVTFNDKDSENENVLGVSCPEAINDLKLAPEPATDVQMLNESSISVLEKIKGNHIMTLNAEDDQKDNLGNSCQEVINDLKLSTEPVNQTIDIQIQNESSNSELKKIESNRIMTLNPEDDQKDISSNDQRYSCPEVIHDLELSPEPVDHFLDVEMHNEEKLEGNRIMTLNPEDDQKDIPSYDRENSCQEVINDLELSPEPVNQTIDVQMQNKSSISVLEKFECNRITTFNPEDDQKDTSSSDLRNSYPEVINELELTSEPVHQTIDGQMQNESSICVLGKFESNRITTLNPEDDQKDISLNNLGNSFQEVKSNLELAPTPVNQSIDVQMQNGSSASVLEELEGNRVMTLQPEDDLKNISNDLVNSCPKGVNDLEHSPEPANRSIGIQMQNESSASVLEKLQGSRIMTLKPEDDQKDISSYDRGNSSQEAINDLELLPEPVNQTIDAQIQNELSICVPEKLESNRIMTLNPEDDQKDISSNDQRYSCHEVINDLELSPEPVNQTIDVQMQNKSSISVIEKLECNRIMTFNPEDDQKDTSSSDLRNSYPEVINELELTSEPVNHILDVEMQNESSVSVLEKLEGNRLITLNPEDDLKDFSSCDRGNSCQVIINDLELSPEPANQTIDVQMQNESSICLLERLESNRIMTLYPEDDQKDISLNALGNSYQEVKSNLELLPKPVNQSICGSSASELEKLEGNRIMTLQPEDDLKNISSNDLVNSCQEVINDLKLSPKPTNETIDVQMQNESSASVLEKLECNLIITLKPKDDQKDTCSCDQENSSQGAINDLELLPEPVNQSIDVKIQNESSISVLEKLESNRIMTLNPEDDQKDISSNDQRYSCAEVIHGSEVSPEPVDHFLDVEMHNKEKLECNRIMNLNPEDEEKDISSELTVKQVLCNEIYKSTPATHSENGIFFETMTDDDCIVKSIFDSEKVIEDPYNEFIGNILPQVIHEGEITTETTIEEFRTDGQQEDSVSEIVKNTVIDTSEELVASNDYAENIQEKLSLASQLCCDNPEKALFKQVNELEIVIDPTKEESSTVPHEDTSDSIVMKHDIIDKSENSVHSNQNTTESRENFELVITQKPRDNIENLTSLTPEAINEESRTFVPEEIVESEIDANVEDSEMGTCYVFPLANSFPCSEFPDSSENLELINESDVGANETIGYENTDEFDISFPELEPELNRSCNLPKVYSNRIRKRKSSRLLDERLPAKRARRSSSIISEPKYKKAKRIDAQKLTNTAINDVSFNKEYRNMLNYYNTLDFSYSLCYGWEHIDPTQLLKRWPIKNCEKNPIADDLKQFDLFTNIDNNPYEPGVYKQTLAEEISVNYDTHMEAKPLTEAADINASMGFGERSDRVIQHLKHFGAISKFSAATLSDVKHYQPVLLSKVNDESNHDTFLCSTEEEQIGIQQFIRSMNLRKKIQLFFQNSAKELSIELIDGKSKDDKELLIDHPIFPFNLCTTEHLVTPFFETVVQVVQVGQLPVSAAAQNPVTCDPRVTQVSDASPSQCSVNNSSPNDTEPEIKQEYTELTTADLSMPIIGQEYCQPIDSRPPTQDSEPPCDTITVEPHMIKSEITIELEEEAPEETEFDTKSHDELQSKEIFNNTDYSLVRNDTNSPVQSNPNVPQLFSSSRAQQEPDVSEHNQLNGAPDKPDQIAHAMNAAGITSDDDSTQNRTQGLVNLLNHGLRQSIVSTSQNSTNSFPKTTSINTMSLHQALAQILPTSLNHNSESHQQGIHSVTPQLLHIVQSKNPSGNITLVDNAQQSVISSPNATSVLHIVQNKATNGCPSSNGGHAQQQSTFSGLTSLQGGNQLLHIMNTGNQKNPNAGQVIKRVNLVTNLTNAQGANEQKMLQFVCKSADGKSIQLNAPHQRSMVLRLQPIETPHSVQTAPQKPTETRDDIPTGTTINAASNKDTASQQEIKSRSVYEENYAKFIQNSSGKPGLEKSTILPKFYQAFGKPVFQEGNEKGNEMNSNDVDLPSVNTENANSECQTSENAMNLEHITTLNNPPLLLRKSPAQVSQSQPNLVQQIKQTIAPMNIQTMHGGVIYTRQIPVNIGGGQTINLISVPTTELMDDSGQKQPEVKFVNQDIEPSIIKIVPQTQTPPNAEVSQEDGNVALHSDGQNPQPQPVLTQMRIKLPMLSKNPQMIAGARVVRPSFFQIQRNVIGGANQPVYQQLVLTAAPPLGQQTIRLPQTQVRTTKPPESQSSSESQMSSSTLEQLREFDMVLEQVKERSTVQPNGNSNNSFTHNSPSTDSTDSPVSTSSAATDPTPVLYSIGGNQPLSVAYVNRKSTVTTPTATSFVRSPDSSGVADSPSSSTQNQMPHTVTTDSAQATQNESTPSAPKSAKVHSKSKSKPKSSSHSSHAVKVNTVTTPKTTTQKPLEDEQTTQRILYILAEYKEQVENSPDKDKPAPRRRSNPPSNPGSSRRKKSRRSGGRDVSPVQGDDASRTMGSEDSSCGTSQGDCTENCLDTSPQGSPRKVARKLTFEQETSPQPRPQPARNVIVADGQTITVARGTAGKPATAVIMPANYLLPVSMVKGGQQIAIVTNQGPKLLTVTGGESPAANALLLQRLIGPAGLKPVLTRPGIRHVRLPTAALQKIQAFNLSAAAASAPASCSQPADSTASPAGDPSAEPAEPHAATSPPWADQESDAAKPDRASSPDGSEPWNMSSAADPHDYTYEETVRTDNLDRTVLEAIPDRYSPDMEAHRIFDKMFDVESKKSFVDSHGHSPRCGFDIDATDEDKSYQVVQKKDLSAARQHRLAHVSAAALRHKYAILEHELRLQKSLSEECEDLGVDSPSASELFPEAELLFSGSPAAQDHGHEHRDHEHRDHEPRDHGPRDHEHRDHEPHLRQAHTPQPTILNESLPSNMESPTPELLPRSRPEMDVNLGLDVGIVTVSEDGMQANIALDQEEFARSHPNTTFHSEPTDDGEVQPFTVTSLKARQITSAIFDPNRPATTVLMTAPPTSVIAQTDTAEPVKYSDMVHMPHLSRLVKDEGLTRYDSILTDTRELHLSNTASAIVHSANTTQVIRRVCYEEDKRERERFLIDEPESLIAGKDAKMVAEDNSRDATLDSMPEDGNSSPERHTELFWESNSASERSESRRPLDFSSDSEKCCKSPLYDETNSTDSSGVGTHMRLDSVIKEARVIERSCSADGSSADDTHPPLRTYPPKRAYHTDTAMDRSVSGKTRAGERHHSPDISEIRRRASNRGVVKRGCHCCNGSPAPSRPKKPRQKKTHSDFTNH